MDRKLIDAAGILLAGDIPAHRYADAEVIEAFWTANAWREKHLGAMRSLHLQLAAADRRLDLQGVTASRLKRMLSIRRKLRKIRVPLSKIQDLGGCRVIVPTNADVRKLGDALTSGDRHRVRKVDDYISSPKTDGYRSLHLKLDYADDRHPQFEGLRMEVQVRSYPQHAWATAVESLGLFMAQNFKGGEGDRAWRRLLLLMASEFADGEGCEPVPGCPEMVPRREEIAQLSHDLGAVGLLDRLSLSFRTIETYVLDPQAKFLLLTYDHEAQSVRVQTFREEPEGAQVYNETERGIQGGDINAAQNLDAVLVSLNKLNDLRQAFPNYFGDVSYFRAQLDNICRGRGLADYDLPRQALAPPKPRETVDPVWLKKPRFDRPKGT